MEIFIEGIFRKLQIDEDVTVFLRGNIDTDILAYTADEQITDKIQQGLYTVVRIRTVKENYCFAVANNSEQFFVHNSTIIEEFNGAIDTLHEGSVLAILPKDTGKDYRVADEAFIVSPDFFIHNSD